MPRSLRQGSPHASRHGIGCQRVPGTGAARLSPPHSADTELLWGTGREAPTSTTASTGTPREQCRWPRKGQWLCICPPATSPDQLPPTSKRASTGPTAAATTSGPQSHPGCSRRDRRLQWLITDVPSRGHCDIKESQPAWHGRSLWAPAPAAPWSICPPPGLRLRPPR